MPGVDVGSCTGNEVSGEGVGVGTRVGVGEEVWDGTGSDVGLGVMNGCGKLYSGGH